MDSGIYPDLRKMFDDMRAEGIYPVVGEGYRTNAEQKRMHKEKVDNQDVYDWLYENAYRYGFILRYPSGKSAVTGIDYEPWHYRYVGEYAEEIHNSGLCLEEWLEEN